MPASFRPPEAAEGVSFFALLVYMWRGLAYPVHPWRLSVMIGAVLSLVWCLDQIFPAQGAVPSVLLSLLIAGLGAGLLALWIGFSPGLKLRPKLIGLDREST